MVTFFAILALILAAVALAYGWKLQQELGAATRRLDRYNRALFDANDQIRTLRAEMEQNMAALRVEVMRAGDVLRFAPETTMLEAELIHPQAKELLAAFHVGGCNDCAAAPGDSLAQVCAARGLPVADLLANLNMLLPSESTPAAPASGRTTDAPQLRKIPNITLEIA
jgi:hypothetical protein